jgi:hypothetical protein|tara:strand:- start:2200 stop:2439 length:240 start_codon:yes stop_codon:yes gene_type:complete
MAHKYRFELLPTPISGPIPVELVALYAICERLERLCAILAYPDYDRHERVEAEKAERAADEDAAEEGAKMPPTGHTDDF